MATALNMINQILITSQSHLKVLQTQKQFVGVIS